jgi:hypothetical protein
MGTGDTFKPAPEDIVPCMLDKFGNPMKMIEVFRVVRTDQTEVTFEWNINDKEKTKALTQA